MNTALHNLVQREYRLSLLTIFAEAVESAKQAYAKDPSCANAMDLVIAQQQFELAKRIVIFN